MGQRLARRMFSHYRHTIQRRRIAHLCVVAKIPRVFGSCYHKAVISKTRGNLLRFAIGDHEGRDSLMGMGVPVIPILAYGMSNLVRVMLIRGKTEFLLRMCIVKEMDSAGNFGADQFKVGQSECANEDSQCEESIGICFISDCV